MQHIITIFQGISITFCAIERNVFTCSLNYNRSTCPPRWYLTPHYDQKPLDH